MKKILFTALLTIIALTTVNAQYRKMSPFVRQAAMEGRRITALAKGVNNSAAHNDSRLVAFVRTTDKEAVTKQGCDALLEFGDVIIASIPLHKIDSLAVMPQVQSIEAEPSNMELHNDISYAITKADKLWKTPTQTLPGYTGKDVVVGVVDAAIDFSHPTFRTADGQQLRIKAVWDFLDFTTNGSESPLSSYIGRQFVGEEQIMQKKCSADSHIQDLTGHGTHTSATAAGSGYNGTTVSPYIGMAPEADLCMVSVLATGNTSLIPQELKFAYTDAANILAYKYIFDYAESVGKPCVMNISMGSPEDLYQNKTENEAISSLVGPGRIICASAGNDGFYYNYIHKPAGKEKAGAFLRFKNPTYNTWLLSSTDYPMVNLTFYIDDNEKVELQFDTSELRETPEAMLGRTLVIDDKEVAIRVYSYPSWVDESRYATDIIIDNPKRVPFGYVLPVSLTLTDANNDIEAFSQMGSFTANPLDPSLNDCDITHCVGMPGSCDDVICVGSASYRENYINYKGEAMSNGDDTEGKRSYYSSIGPNKKGNIKPDVMAPGQNVISAMNSYYYEAMPEDSYDRENVIETFESDGRTYGWQGMSGTSQASPVATGIVALWLQQNPDLTPDNIREVIAHTSRHEVAGYEYPNNEYGYGAIDAVAGMDYIKENFPTAVKGITAIPTSAPAAYYDINGCRLNSLNGKRGIVIVKKNGNIHKVLR